MEEFKKKVRFLIDATKCETTRAAFASSQQSVNSSLKPLIIEGSIANIRVKPMVSQQMATRISKAVISCRSKGEERAEKALEEMLQT